MNPLQAKQLRIDIAEKLKTLDHGTLAGHASDLLGALGYQSDKTLALTPNNFRGFQEAFLDGCDFRQDRAVAAEWKSVDVVFQYTDSEVKANGQVALGVFAGRDFSQSLYDSFVFLAVDLTGDSYTRTQLAEATREINKPFGMPVIVLFRHGATLTLAVIDRRMNKKDDTKDVLEKVTLIKDVRCHSPHRAHVEILSELTLDRLMESHTITNFVSLHAAWRKTLDTSALNKKFYKELADWYFWALSHVTFPPQVGVTADVNAATNVIRLITRLMFTWFLKERGLVPEVLFDRDKLAGILTALPIDGSDYYKAILQNLFFATLNTEMDDPAHPRRFRGRNTGKGQDSHYGIPNVLRYDSSFKNTNDALALFAPIPFLNGGLFECLDQTPQGAPRVFVDGFSDRDDNPLRVPNFLFFSEARDVDLNSVYNTSGKTTKVRGLLPILHSYKFTVAENTPVEEEIALDPELLGRVFENLLASYNPETGATARKQTGSFYTPREIVNYMVDEALIAALETALTSVSSAPEGLSPNSPALQGRGSALNDRLRHLFAYTTDPPQFSESEVTTLITAIDALKILDPACGSGAFPMGILQKLVFVLAKLDPQNVQWRDRQIAKAEAIDDPQTREHAVADIEQAFDKNDLDYGRKLYLINSGIYGVDIQPIAMQIAKLRFFISLMIDQRIDDAAPNKGVRALPNLETKFVAANTLIGIDQPAQGNFGTLEIEEKEKQLKAVRDRHFSARTRATKDKCREEDKRLRGEICALLEAGNWPHDKALLLASWNPYDQNQSAGFFDPEWMFSVSSGFDIVIANPPYISHDRIPKHLDLSSFTVYEGFADIYCYFFETGLKALNSNGILSFITSNSYIKAEYGSPLRNYLGAKTSINQLINVHQSQVFDAAIVNVAIMICRASRNVNAHAIVVNATYDGEATFADFVSQNASYYPQAAFSSVYWCLVSEQVLASKLKIEAAGKTLEARNTKIRLGIATGSNEVFVIDEAKREQFLTRNAANAEIIKPILRGRDVERFIHNKPSYYVLLTKNGIDVEKDYPDIYQYLDSFGDKFKQRGAKGKKWYNLRACAFFDDFQMEKIIWIELAEKGRFALCEDEVFLINSAYFLLPPSGLNSKYLLGILNSKLIQFYMELIAGTSGMGTIRWINYYVKGLPIPDASAAEQAPVIVLVDAILAAKRADPAANVTVQEAEIDGLVNALYGL